MRKILASDYNKDSFNSENMRPDITPPCNKAIFDNIRIDDYHLPPQSLEHTPCYNSLIISKSFLPVVRRELGGERRDEAFNVGHVITNPAGVSHSACWDQAASYSVLTIENNFFNHTAYEFRDPDRIDFLPQFPKFDPHTYGISQLLDLQIQCQKSVDLERIDELATDLVVHLLQNDCSIICDLPENNHVLSTCQLQRVFEYIEDNLSRKIRLQELADLLGLSRFYFSRQFKESTNTNISQHITERRLKKAIHLLQKTNLGVGAIARQAGFHDHSHLCRVFRKIFQLLLISAAKIEQYYPRLEAK
jgi:AraC family transcriptional regulator